MAPALPGAAQSCGICRDELESPVVCIRFWSFRPLRRQLWSPRPDGRAGAWGSLAASPVTWTSGKAGTDLVTGSRLQPGEHFVLGWAVALIRACGSAELRSGAALTLVAGWGCGQVARAEGGTHGVCWESVRLMLCGPAAWAACGSSPRPDLAARVLVSESVC